MQKYRKPYALAASLICGNMLHLQSDIDELEKSHIDSIHFDVMDGIFVPRYGLFPEILTQIRKVTNIPIDVHMMVENPEVYIKTFVSAGLNQENDYITIHLESTKHVHRVLQTIRSYNIKAGIALNPATPLHALDYILEEIDLVMLMAINPGIVGHTFIPATMKKITNLHKKLSDYPNIIIEVDGGVTFQSASEMIGAGANMLVCGSQTIFSQENSISHQILKLQGLLSM